MKRIFVVLSIVFLVSICGNAQSVLSDSAAHGNHSHRGHHRHDKKRHFHLLPFMHHHHKEKKGHHGEYSDSQEGKHIHRHHK